MDEPSANVLSYFPERQRLGSPSATWSAIVVPGLVTVVVSAAAGLGWGALSGALVVAYLWRQHRRTKVPAQATFRVDDGRLSITNAGGWDLVDGSLDELRDVVLDTKIVQKFQEDTLAGFPDVRAVHTRMASPIDNSRIELVTASTVVPLTDHYTSNIDATEWLVKIRRFLRHHGWRPHDERDGNAA